MNESFLKVKYEVVTVYPLILMKECTDTPEIFRCIYACTCIVILHVLHGLQEKHLRKQNCY